MNRKQQSTYGLLATGIFLAALGVLPLVSSFPNVLPVSNLGLSSVSTLPSTLSGNQLLNIDACFGGSCPPTATVSFNWAGSLLTPAQALAVWNGAYGTSYTSSCGLMALWSSNVPPPTPTTSYSVIWSGSSGITSGGTLLYQGTVYLYDYQTYSGSCGGQTTQSTTPGATFTTPASTTSSSSSTAATTSTSTSTCYSGSASPVPCSSTTISSSTSGPYPYPSSNIGNLSLFLFLALPFLVAAPVYGMKEDKHPTS